MPGCSMARHSPLFLVIPCLFGVRWGVHSQMMNLLTHIVGKDEDNVWLYAGARAEEGGGEGGEEEEEVDGGHLPALGSHSVIRLQLIILHILCWCPHA